MGNELEERGNALENEYFHRQEKELLAKMRAKIENETAEKLKIKAKCPQKGCDCDMKEVDFESIKIDVCDHCGGVWLDAGELAQLMHKDENKSGWFNRLFD